MIRDLPPALWRRIQRTNFTNPQKLAAFLEIPPTDLIVNKNFPLNLPRRLAAKIEKGNLADPLLRQFVPLAEELETQEGFGSDPVGDTTFQRAPKLLHKYKGRVLLVTTSACAMHCRYCFRQHYPYEAQPLFHEELTLIASDNTISEVILSGGDPLSLSNKALGDLLDQISAIPHIKRIRFHTRFPIGIPERIDPEFLDLLRNRPIWFVIHSNHPSELDNDVLAALGSIRKLGIPVLNQAVLLRGVNDDLETLRELCEKSVDAGIIPYYLHQLDRVAGATHFEVDPARGLALIEELRATLPGYAIPEYVREVAGKPNKSPLAATSTSMLT